MYSLYLYFRNFIVLRTPLVTISCAHANIIRNIFVCWVCTSYRCALAVCLSYSHICIIWSRQITLIINKKCSSPSPHSHIKEKWKLRLLYVCYTYDKGIMLNACNVTYHYLHVYSAYIRIEYTEVLAARSNTEEPVGRLVISQVMM